MESRQNKRTYKMVLAGLSTALMCILAPLSLTLPFTPVPVSLTNLVIYLTLYLLGWKLGTVSYLVYLLLGLAGLPVFSGFTGGPGKLLGPTGGYLIGFAFMAVISGLFIECCQARSLQFAGCVLGALVTDLFGTVWLARQTGRSFGEALGIGVLPFIPGDLAKILLVLALAPVLVRRLRQAGLLPPGSGRF